MGKNIQNRSDLSKESLRILWKDKELIIIALADGLIRGVFYLLLFSLIYFFIIRSITYGIQQLLILSVVFILGIILKISNTYISAFFTSAIIYAASELFDGKEIRMSQIIHKTLLNKKRISSAFFQAIKPHTREIVSFFRLKRFLLHEVILRNKTAEEAMETANKYNQEAWVKDLLMNVKWTIITIPFIVFGIFSLYILFKTLTTFNPSLMLSDEGKSYVSLTLIATGVVYFAVYDAVLYATTVIYETLVFRTYVEKK